MDLLGEPVYIKLDIPELSRPFYNVKSTPSIDKVSFNVSVLDTSKIIVDGEYRIRIFNDLGEDITPEEYKNVPYSISTTSLPIEVDVPRGDRAVLCIYSVYDLNNTGQAADGSPLISVGDMAYEDIDETYLKLSVVGYPLGDKGYNIGDVQIAQINSQYAGIYFTNSVNLDMIKRINYVVINQSGASTTYNEGFVPSAVDDRFLYELSHKFMINGIYQVQIRLYDEDNNMSDEMALTLFKNY